MRCTLTRSLQHIPKKGDKVVVALSGGVDSAVAAKLLTQQEDYDLSAVFMRNWDTVDETGSEIDGCGWKKDWSIVQATCKQLSLPVEIMDLSVDYWNLIFEPAIHDWRSGVNPNPDIWCNRYIKFGSLLDRIQDKFKGTWLATGHYARTDICNLGFGRQRTRLLRALDRHKDQTYFLSSVPYSSLAKAIFPLGTLQKIEVRALAQKWELPSAKKKESMGLCFIGKKKKFTEFVSSYMHPSPGPIVHHITGEVLGTHEGLWNYTIGQGAKLQGMPTRMFVARKDLTKNEIRLVPGSTHPALQSLVVKCQNWEWIWPYTPHQDALSSEGLLVSVRLGRNWKEAPCLLNYDSNFHQATLTFKTPQIAAAPGQVAVAWLDDWCLGCGTILSAETLS